MNICIITINSPESYNSFLILYQLAFIIPFLILLVAGIRRRYDMRRWLAIMMAASFCFLLGTRFSTFTMDDWSALFRDDAWPLTQRKFALGGRVIRIMYTEDF